MSLGAMVGLFHKLIPYNAYLMCSCHPVFLMFVYGRKQSHCNTDINMQKCPIDVLLFSYATKIYRGIAVTSLAVFRIASLATRHHFQNVSLSVVLGLPTLGAPPPRRPPLAASVWRSPICRVDVFYITSAALHGQSSVRALAKTTYVLLQLQSC